MAVTIKRVIQHSPCCKKGLSAGDRLISINGNEINDVLDYRFYGDESKLKLIYQKESGKIHHCTLRNITDCDDMGLEFETYLMDKHKHCLNHCIFCFIDQMPKGMRSSLYFKDDDSRLSFLFGNYITLTNLSEHDVERIIKMRISPVNVSVHTMNPELRVKMMKNPKAGEAVSLLSRFSDAGIAINAQLVLCPGINDGSELEFSLKKLSELKSVVSVAAVPVGLTKFREGLYPLTKFTPNGAKAVINTINSFNDRLIAAGRPKLAYPSDEFYLLSSQQLPNCSYYNDFPQIENGVGMLSLLQNDFFAALNSSTPDSKKRCFAIATGVAAYPLISKIAKAFCQKNDGSEIKVYEIKNTFFGENCTVAGLITGSCLTESLISSGFSCPVLMLPEVMFKSKDELVFLDDYTKEDVERELNTKIIITDSDGYNMLEAFLAQ